MSDSKTKDQLEFIPVSRKRCLVLAVAVLCSRGGGSLADCSRLEMMSLLLLDPLELPGVFVCSGCYNKIPQTGWLINNRNISHSSRSWKPEIKVPAWLSEGLLLRPRLPVSSHGGRA